MQVAVFSRLYFLYRCSCRPLLSSAARLKQNRAKRVNLIIQLLAELNSSFLAQFKMPIAYLDDGNLQLLAKGLVKSDRVLISVANCPKLEETLHAPLANPDLLLFRDKASNAGYWPSFVTGFSAAMAMAKLPSQWYQPRRMRSIRHLSEQQQP